MTGLFIPDMELPEFCCDCPCNDGEFYKCRATKEHRHAFIDKPEWCPLIEITQVDFDTFIEGRIKTFNIPPMGETNEPG